jgi:hypothetical protein
MKSFVLALTVATSAASASPFHADAELDPTAYVLSGSSLHVGLGYDRYRLDVGNFALAVPQFVHGNDGNDVSFDGFGMKLQVFADPLQRGAFAGVDINLARELVRRGSLADRYDQLQVGIDGGYRFAIGDRIYVTPWLGVSYAFGARDVMLETATTKAMHVVVFPAIHIGCRFR